MTAEASSLRGAPTAAAEAIDAAAVAGNDEKKREEEKKKPDEPPSAAAPPPPVDKCSSFKEESNFSSDLKETEKKALSELRAKVEEAILEGKLLKKKEEPKPKEKKEDVKEKETANQEAPEGEEGEKAKLDQAADEKAKEATSAKEKAAPSAEKAVKTEAEEPVEVKAEEAASGEEKGAPLEVKAIETAASEAAADDKEIALWGVPLLPSKGSESTDVILLKFLRARDFKVKEAFEMLQNVLQWRKESKIDSILDEESLGADFAAACYMDGVDREGHPMCYNVSGVFQDAGLYQKTFGSEEGREKFLKWRVQLMEKGIKKLDFKPGGVASLLQIIDLENSPGLSKKELRTCMKQVVQLLQDNYPEFVTRNIFINVPFWYYAFHALISPFLTQRTRSKFVFARTSKVAETLLRYIPAEAIPVSCGGFKRNNDTDFSVEYAGVTELIVKAGSTENVEIPSPEAGSTLLWDLTVLGWEVNYKEEFVPIDEGSYTVVVKKGKKMGSQEEPIRNSFRNNEPGKIVLTIENNTFWKKKVLYRYKTKSS